MHMGSFLSARFRDFSDDGRPIPREATKVISDHWNALEAAYGWDYDDTNQEYPCLWLDMETRKCRWYDWRPDVCRDFEVGCGPCLEHRRRIGVGCTSRRPRKPGGRPPKVKAEREKPRKGKGKAADAPKLT
jgi:Putative zinc- or iron-chelating domain